MGTARFREENRIRARMMNEATGMDLTASIAGASSSSTRRNRAEKAASTVPAATPRKKPTVIRTRE